MLLLRHYVVASPTVGVAGFYRHVASSRTSQVVVNTFGLVIHRVHQLLAFDEATCRSGLLVLATGS